MPRYCISVGFPRDKQALAKADRLYSSIDDRRFARVAFFAISAREECNLPESIGL
jgi:hypothetical protein